MKRCRECQNLRGELTLTREGLCMDCFRPEPAAIRRVGERLLRQHNKHGDEALNMELGGIYQEWHRFPSLCQTVACHGGHYFLGFLDEVKEAGGEIGFDFVLLEDPDKPRLHCLVNTSTNMIAGYVRGTELMARDLGFVNALQLMRWARQHPELWGCEGGDMMFGSHCAFGKADTDRLLLYDIGHWWLAVAGRVEAEPQAAERPHAEPSKGAQALEGWFPGATREQLEETARQIEELS